ncbi:prepilin-type N-terminal cleavage/methylation domain-containing protein, partial [bacterium]|nr:prepilin-type N-terminal cleavage/methylation domain-containing protein [bacterium]
MNNVNRRSRGFSLIEILLALAILAIGLLSILAVFPAGLKSYQKSRDQTMLATLVRTKVNQLMYGLSDPNLGSKQDQATAVEAHYLRAGQAFARYFEDTGDTRKRWSGPVYESQVYPFEESERYYWQYVVTDAGIAGPMRIGRSGVKGVLFQVEFKV